MAPSRDAQVAAIAAARQNRVRALAKDTRNRLPIGELLQFLVVFTQFWTNEAVALESDTTRGSKGRRDDCRTAARLIGALRADLESLPDDEPSPADAAVVAYLSGETPEGESYNAIEDQFGRIWIEQKPDLYEHDGMKWESAAIRACKALPSYEFIEKHEQRGNEWCEICKPSPAESEAPDINPGLVGELLVDVPGTVGELPETQERQREEITLQPINWSPFTDPEPVSGAPGTVGRVLTFAELLQAPTSPPVKHRSFSQVESYADCGLKYRLQRREPGVIQRPSWALVGGKAIHAAIESFERDVIAVNGAGVLSEFDPVTCWSGCFNDSITAQAIATPQYPMDHWRSAARGAEGYTWWLHEGVDMLSRYVAWRHANAGHWAVATWNDVPMIEWPFETNFGDIHVVGFIDLVLREATTGRLKVIDVKSGKSAPVDSLQLKTYGAVLADQTLPSGTSAHDEIDGAYFMLRRGELADVGAVSGLDARAEIFWRYGAMDASERAGVYMARPSSFCGGCSVKHACPVRSSD